ncbi:MAG: phosphatase PAP2 family protein [Candidatus Lokiarchaeota archaeon]|nr:phosphatase PAP2 family protein [Candidatus Lokiarchaeota archaeon]MBD3200536.1 phosphatase PAP2 family protein [Candidatus Lokiarchaeota archaeon]
MSEYKYKNHLSIKTLLIIQFIIIVIAFMGLGLVKSIDTLYIDNNIIQTLFKAITYVGDTLVFIIIIAIIYIVYDKQYAKDLTLVLLATVYVNSILKDIFMDPRPTPNSYGDPTPENPAGLIETGYGFPSGHSQDSATFWGYISYEFKEKPKPLLVPVILSILVFLVAFSRVIIGVHDLQDVTGGLVMGIGVLLVCIYLRPVITEKVRELSLVNKIIIGTIVSVILLVVGVIFFPTSGEQLLPNPIQYSDTGAYAQISGVLLGLSIGYVLENEYIKYDPTRLATKHKILNLVLGLIIVFIVYYGLEALKGVFDSVIYRYIRYALITFILVFIAPLIFTKINPKE